MNSELRISDLQNKIGHLENINQIVDSLNSDLTNKYEVIISRNGEKMNLNKAINRHKSILESKSRNNEGNNSNF